MKVLAVVIGNNDYFDPDKLKNAVNDAQAMETVFQIIIGRILPLISCAL